ncbi:MULTISPECIES: PglL family O-oligosaccharyltransferase [unclassified Acinetobacter]|uniref:PglL family O-oligosaccharyltransferase n=1 Tax=unclassified Acinetobacter TaxID=196816 RepID=UPI0015D1D3D9|nr:MULTISPECIES: O-antigen ligase family protein [unclassified Acinetobacter]
MKTLLYLCAAICIALAWLIPIHYRPWATYTGELYTFFALFALAATFFKQKLDVAKISLPLLVLAAVPLMQLMLGQIYYFSIALLCMLFVFSFWLCVNLGFSLSRTTVDREKTFLYLSYTFVASGVLTGLIAICQWLDFDSFLPFVMKISGTTRPFANFAQPNNMATFLLMALLACLYLYEQGKVKTRYLVAAAIPILIGIALSQSRTSWVASLCILLYLAYAQYRDFIRLRWFYSLAWFIGFIALIVLMPKLSQMIIQLSDMNIQESRDIAQRAGGDMSRLAIWTQMAHAVAAQPWFGYGWHQTSTAFVAISDTVPGPVWVRSAHNFILDFLLWNGAIIGIPFLAYFAYWGIQLQKMAKSALSVIGLLMVGVFVIHAMLEFPQNYAYFLLPIGFIIGILQAGKLNTSAFQLSPWFIRIVFMVGAILITVIYRDYANAAIQLGQASKYEKSPEKITNHEPIYLLTEFKHRVAIIRLSPYQKVSAQTLQETDKLVRSYPAKYHIIKYARLLAFNGYEAEARHQLQRLKTIYKIDMPYEDLLPPITATHQ